MSNESRQVDANTVESLMTMIKREAAQVEKLVDRTANGDYPVEVRNIRESLAKMDEFMGQINAEVVVAKKKQMEQQGGGDPFGIAKKEEPQGQLTAPQEANAMNTIKNAAVAGLKAGTASAASHGLAQAVKNALGDKLPPFFLTPAGEALLKLATPMLLSSAATHYGEHLPGDWGKQLGEISDLAIAGTTADVVEEGFKAVAPFIGEVLQIGAGAVSGKFQIPAKAEGGDAPQEDDLPVWG